ARIIAHLEHPHIVHVLEYGLEGNIPYLVLSYAPHGSMRQRYPKGARLPLETIVETVRQLADALQYAHAQKLVHGDVKPENILIGRKAETLLSDFGVAVVASHSQQRKDISGTIAYMSPEQLRGEPGYASDQYALGIVVYEWLSGSRPFTGSYAEIAMQHMRAMPSSLLEKLPDLSPSIERVVMKALAKDPQQRFESITDFAAALEQAAQPAALEASGADDTVAMQEEELRLSQLAVPLRLPYHRNPYFTGREGVLIQLHEQLSAHLPSQQSSRPTMVVALSGMGGIGKTQTAIEYAYRYSDTYTAVFWARADSGETLFADFVGIAQQLRLIDASGTNAEQASQAVAAVTNWLATHPRWLLILDNLDDFALLYRFVPPTSSGSILLTTRAQSTGTHARRLELEQMTEEEGVRFLLARSKLYAPGASNEKISEADRIEALDIYHLLDGLPLALDQAGAFIEETGCTLFHYIELFRQRRSALLGQRGEGDLFHPEPVTTTIQLAIEKVERVNPAAVDLLRLCAYLHADGVGEELLVEYDLDQAIAALRRYSLVSRNADQHALSLHRLAQAVVMDSLVPQAQRAWAERAIAAVTRAFPNGDNVANWSRCERLLPHVSTCLQHIEQWELASPEAARLLDQAGVYLFIHGQYALAAHILRLALVIRETMQKDESNALAETLNTLASCYLFQGDFAQAEPLFTRVLTDCEALHGAYHADVANALNNLALLFIHRGLYIQAEVCLERAMSIWNRLEEEQQAKQGRQEQHPDLARTLNNLALLYHHQGKLREAEQYYLRGLAIWETVHGPSHPDLAVHLNNLAMLYFQMHNDAQAEPLFRRALEIREKTLGSEHPAIAHSLTYLARSYQRQWKYAEAELLFKQALKIRRRALGPEHPETAHSLSSLAKLYLSQGKHLEAETLYRQALSIREQALGPDHPDVASLLKNYAILLISMKRKEEAVQLATRARAIRAKQPVV
ncbi:MAG TPA: FxSxx-COOH system tetratricopeptide repeat protein, partial [Ktedonobacteraceae bacterium]|nr:FxSxx-COOH system tetratricopeptide repeat protein [Ktedonobacteraceae bacterium]